MIAEREAKGPAPVQSDLILSATILSPSKSLSHTFPGSGSKKAYIHVIQTSGYNTEKAKGATVKISNNDGTSSQELKEGDAAYLTTEGGSELIVENIGDSPAEILLFDLWLSTDKNFAKL